MCSFLSLTISLAETLLSLRTCHSSKGAKDARDLLRIGALTNETNFDASLVAPYLNDDHLALFERLRRSPEAVAMTDGNAVPAKKLRASLERVLTQVEEASDSPPGVHRPPYDLNQASIPGRQLRGCESEN